eukprot:3729331-Heterocapsa_arctica.AAC.1
MKSSQITSMSETPLNTLRQGEMCTNQSIAIFGAEFKDRFTKSAVLDWSKRTSNKKSHCGRRQLR